MPITDTAPIWETENGPIEKWESSPAPSFRKPEDVDLEKEIGRAKEILQLSHNWDGEGSVSYSQNTLDRAVAFLKSHSNKAHELCGIYPAVPRIGPAEGGSIDLHWKEEKWELLVNIPVNETGMAVFYGDDYGVQKIKGSFDPRNVNIGIVAWLMPH